MKKVLKKIQRQSYFARLVIFCACVSISMFLIGLIWINSFKKSFVALKTSTQQIEKPFGELPPLKDFLKSNFQNLFIK